MMRTILVLALIASWALIAGRGDAAPPDAGRAVYLKYCSACHGAEGRGDGVASSTMRPRPTDLTQLAKAHGGKFPYVAVRDTIDGRKSIAAHGSSEMPVWGEVFSREKAATQHDAQVRSQVQLITDYLASIQAK